MSEAMPTPAQQTTLRASIPKALGTARYGSDIYPEGVLSGVVLRTPVPHARILKIDVNEARSMPGVQAVATANDIPGQNVVSKQVLDQPVLAMDKTRSAVDALALVAADTYEAAQAAADRIKVDLEPLPAVYSPLDALAPGAPLVHEGGNLLAEYHLNRGDINAGFASCDTIVEDTFVFPPVEHAYLEPDTGVAEPTRDGGVRIWYGCNSVYVERGIVAKVLDLPDDKVEVIHPYTGGVFGGRNEGLLPSYVALLAMITGRPIRISYNRKEMFTATTKRHPQIINAKLGSDNHGRLLAASYEIISDTGAYAHWGPSILLFCSIGAPGPYRTPNTHVHTKVVYTNNVTMGAMRSWGMQAVTFATESLLERIAAKLDIHPLVLRWLNAVEDGDEIITDQVLPEGVGLKDTIAAAAKEMGVGLPG